MNRQASYKWLWIDPRTKILLLLICVIAAAMAPNLTYEMGLVLLIACFALFSGKVRFAIGGAIGYVFFYGISMLVMFYASETLQASLLAFLGLVHKIYPCGFMGGIIISTTKISEFLSAMNKLHAPKSLTIPLAIMLRYIPTIQEDWHFIKDAMRLRDVSPSLGGILSRPAMTLECIYAPLLMAASKASDELSIASVTRGIENPLSRTCYVDIHFHFTDVLVVVCFLVYVVIGRFL